MVLGSILFHGPLEDLTEWGLNCKTFTPCTIGDRS